MDRFTKYVCNLEVKQISGCVLIWYVFIGLLILFAWKINNAFNASNTTVSGDKDYVSL